MTFPNRPIPSLSPEYILRLINNTTRNRGWCQIWNGACDKDGYAIVHLRGGSNYRVSRILYRHCFAVDPGELVVCHKCDNPSCCEPQHFFLDTHAGNQRDCTRKRRRAYGVRNGRYTHPESTARGEQSGTAKLTAAQVCAIRREYVPYRVSARVLAQKYGINRTTVQRIIDGTYWKSL